MGELHEIVSAAAVGRLFDLLAIVCPLLGMGLGAIVGSRRGRLRSDMLNGLTIGLLGTLNWALWHIYNALTDRNGLDTVRNLVINLLLFVLLGGIIGLVASRFLFRKQNPPLPPDDPEGALVGAGVGGPTRGSGNARTIEEALEPPRNP